MEVVCGGRNGSWITSGATINGLLRSGPSSLDGLSPAAAPRHPGFVAPVQDSDYSKNDAPALVMDSSPKPTSLPTMLFFDADRTNGFRDGFAPFLIEVFQIECFEWHTIELIQLNIVRQMMRFSL